MKQSEVFHQDSKSPLTSLKKVSTTSPLFSLAKFGPQLTDVQTSTKVSGQVYVHFLSHFCIMIKTEFIT